MGKIEARSVVHCWRSTFARRADLLTAVRMLRPDFETRLRQHGT